MYSRAVACLLQCVEPCWGAGFEEVAQQLPKFDIDKHGNRLDKPFDPYGELFRLLSVIALAGHQQSAYAASMVCNPRSAHGLISVMPQGIAVAVLQESKILKSVVKPVSGTAAKGCAYM